jgi:phospholipid/cholesterol/gamma-HCH transport system permease protein
MKFFSEVGSYLLLQREVFKMPENFRLYRKKLLFELKTLGLDSLPIVSVISIFVGAAIVIQLAANLANPIYPRWITGFSAREGIMLEFAPTMINLVLAGKIGSHIASELGTMRITEQIDALDVMGVNSASYLILPKVIACLIFSPMITIISIFLALFGGWIFGVVTGTISSYDYMDGLQLDYTNKSLIIGLVKGFVYSFIISSVSSFRGYTVKGGALEVGRASTRAVVESCITLIIANLIITNLLL